MQFFCVKAKTRAVHSLKATGGGIWVAGLGFSVLGHMGMGLLLICARH